MLVSAAKPKALSRAAPPLPARALSRAGPRVTPLQPRARSTDAHRTRAAQQTDITPMASSSAPADEEELFELTKYFIQNGGYFGPFTDKSLELISEDFIFRGPLVGPLTRKGYIANLEALGIYKTIADIQANPWGFSIDPLDPNRVWFMIRETGTMSKDWKFGPATFPATGKSLQLGPSTYSVIFTPDKKIKYLSIGYCADRIISDAPGGDMGVAAVAVGRAANAPSFGPVLGGGPFESALRGVVNLAMRTTGASDDLADTPWEELPEWYKAHPNSKLYYGQGM